MLTFFKPTDWPFSGATYSFQDSVGFTSTLAKRAPVDVSIYFEVFPLFN